MFIKTVLKKIFLFTNDKTIKTRFFFDGEYKRWQKFDENRNENDAIKIENLGGDKNIFFLVPGAAISGGIAVVFQHANRLLEKGYSVKILSLNNKNNGSWFPNQKVEIIPYREAKKILQSEKIDILIATSYSTAFTVDVAKARRKIYFVQSDESRFFPENPRLCEVIKKTYTLPIEYITEAKWIQKWLKDEFGHESHYVPNGIDLELFKKVEPIAPKSNKPRILIEGSINVPFKGMDEAYAAVKDLECELWIVSNNGKPKKGWKYNRFFESVPYGKMNEIYSSCDIFLKMSKVEGFFGPPMEAMACGCAVVVGKVTGFDEYIKDDYNALVVEQGDIEGARKAVKRLIEDIDLRKRLIENGYRTAREWSWNNSVVTLEKIINS